MYLNAIKWTVMLFWSDMDAKGSPLLIGGPNFMLFVGHLGTEGNLEGTGKSETHTGDIKARGFAI